MKIRERAKYLVDRGDIENFYWKNMSGERERTGYVVLSRDENPCDLYCGMCCERTGVREFYI